MSGNYTKIIATLMIVLIALLTLAANGLEKPQSQMDMPTDTLTPASAGVTSTPVMQETPTLEATVEVLTAASPTMTSIFTGFTPYPNSTSGYYGPMGGSAGSGSCSGMSSGGMGSGGMGMSSGYITGTLPMGSMGGMGSGGMSMDGCSMMSGSMDMSGMNMSGMNMSEIDMAAMNMAGTNMTGSITNMSSSIFDRPWVLIGWIVLVLLVLAILVAAAFGIAWIIRRSRRVQTS